MQFPPIAFAQEEAYETASKADLENLPPLLSAYTKIFMSILKV
jgi:hypothetical protein